MISQTSQTQLVSNIAAHRQQAGLTQRELAVALEMTEATVQNWERGRVGAMQIQRVMVLCEMLNCRVRDLVEVGVDGEAEASIWVPRIKDLRKQRGLKQRQIALALEVTERTIKSWEKGDAGIDIIVRLMQLCELFNCEVQDLLIPAEPRLSPEAVSPAQQQQPD